MSTYMGWLFKKKEKALPPLPLPGVDDHQALNFPTTPPPKKILEAEKMKAAAGVAEALPQLQEEPVPKVGALPPPPMAQPLETPAEDILYVKMDVYQRILGELGHLRAKLTHVHEVNKLLETSEYNEDHAISKANKAVKVMHDRLLYMDKVLFKPQR
jgi:hypothetical protein